MEHQVRFRITITGDTIVGGVDSAAAWLHVKEKIAKVVEREYADQRSGLESHEGDEGFFYGLTLRLPGSLLIHDVKVLSEGVEPHHESTPRLRLVRCKGVDNDS